MEPAVVQTEQLQRLLVQLLLVLEPGIRRPKDKHGRTCGQIQRLIQRPRPAELGTRAVQRPSFCTSLPCKPLLILDISKGGTSAAVLGAGEDPRVPADVRAGGHQRGQCDRAGDQGVRHALSSQTELTAQRGGNPPPELPLASAKFNSFLSVCPSVPAG